mgnify:CR=1 FL=1
MKTTNETDFFAVSAAKEVRPKGEPKAKKEGDEKPKESRARSRRRGDKKLLVFPRRGKVYQLERIIKPVLTNPIGNDCGFVGNNGIYTPI